MHVSETHSTTTIHTNERGIALIGVFLLLLIALAGAALLAAKTHASGNMSERQQQETLALYAAETGIAWAEQAIFNDWGSVNDGTPADTMQSFQARLSGNFPLPADLGGGNTTVPNGAGPVQLFANYTLPNSAATVQNVTVSRTDNGATSSQFTVVSTGADAWGNTRQVTEVFNVNGRDVNYNDFALLAKNITCIMCHLRVDNVDRFYNSTPGLNDESRVKVGSLESMIVRDAAADTQIAGTFYTQGIVTNKSGVPMTSAMWQSSTIDANPFDATSQFISEPLSSTNMTDTPVDGGTGLPVANGNLYLDYSSDPAVQKQVDGELPTDFFTIFEDLNGDRSVSVADVEATKPKFTGEITGGIKVNVPFGSTYGSGGLPMGGNIATVGDSTVVGGTYHSGNLILVGTDANPIQLDGAVGVYGDVMISGVVQGAGQLYASGNVYVVGDITYKDGAGLPFGYTDVGGTPTRTNSLFIGSGDNILIGDYLTTQGGTISDVNDQDTGDHNTSPGFSFTMSEIALFNRSEWEKTQPFLPNDAGLALVPNPYFDPTHHPVYFNMGPGAPVYIYNGPMVSSGKVKGTYFDAGTASWQGKEHAGSYSIWEDRNFNGILDPGEDVNGNGSLDTSGVMSMYTEAEASTLGATISSYNPSGTGAGGAGWITTPNLKSIWNQIEAARTSGNPFRIDAAMRTSQSIFALSRSSSKYGTKTDGQMIINGAVVASHVGILSPGGTSSSVGLQLNFDRVAASASGGVTSEDPTITRIARWYK